MKVNSIIQIIRKRSQVIYQILIIMILIFPIFGIIKTRYIPGSGLLDLIMFGKLFEKNRLVEVNKLHPPTDREWGNDGQFYVQIAIDPFLHRAEELDKALDIARYRARRIGLPLTAFFFGFGQPSYVIHVYALINFLFWFVLLFLLQHFVGFETRKQLFVALSLLWTTGSITSISRALPDLPAITVILAAIWIDSFWFLPALLFSYSVLIKETSIFSILGVILKSNETGIKRKIINFLIIIVPMILWLLYINTKLGGTSVGINNFSIPLKDFVSKIIESYKIFVENVNKTNPWPLYRWFLLFDFCCPISLFFQSIYLLCKPRIKSIEWMTGVGFAVLLLFLGSSVWNDPYAYTRVLLPLTFCFNLILYKFEKNNRYLLWFIIGNIGMLWGIIEVFYNLFP